jgi:nicotinamide mononucleotide transporter
MMDLGEIGAAVMTWLFAPLSLPLGLVSSWAEVGGFATGVASVALAARASIWTWPVGIANSLFWLALFLVNGLYADSALQAVYIVLGAYGTWHWLRGGPQRADDLPISRTPPRTAVAVAGTSLAGIVLGTWLLATRTNSTVPLLDVETTVVSLAAMYLLARKHIENWPVWIVGVNVPYIGLYLGKGLALTAILQLVFIALSVVGWSRWWRELRASDVAVPAANAPVPVVGEAA